MRWYATLFDLTTGQVSVAYGTADGTAVAGDDYLATAGSFTLPVGETSEAIAVTVLSDEEA